jgi:hypothetical protein
MCDLLIDVRRGARADKPTAVEPEQAAEDGDVIPFPFGRN